MLRPHLIWKKTACLQFSFIHASQLVSRKMAAVSTRFGELSPDEIQRLLDNATAKSTVKATKFGMKIFNGEFCFHI